MKPTVKLTIVLVLLCIGVLSTVTFVESVTHYNAEQVTGTDISQQYITNYEDLSEQQKQLFRESLSNPSEITEDQANSLERQFIKLDGEIYKTEITTGASFGSFFIILFTFFMFLESFRSIDQIFQSKNTEYGTYILAILLIVTISLFIPVTGIFTTESINQISEYPVPEQNNTQQQTQHILYLDQNIQDNLYEIMKGGEPISKQNNTYVSLEYSSTYLNQYDYIQSDGELYHVQQIESDMFPVPLQKLFTGLLCFVFTLLYVFLTRPKQID